MSPRRDPWDTSLDDPRPPPMSADLASLPGCRAEDSRTSSTRTSSPQRTGDVGGGGPSGRRRSVESTRRLCLSGYFGAGDPERRTGLEDGGVTDVVRILGFCATGWDVSRTKSRRRLRTARRHECVSVGPIYGLPCPLVLRTKRVLMSGARTQYHP